MTLHKPRKDEENELPIAEVWRPTIEQVVRRFVAGDYALGEAVPGVAPVSAETATQILEYVEAYGATLVALDPEAWESSVSLWMGDKWEVLVDLWTEDEGPSDLVLHLYVREDGPGYRFEVHLVYVPRPVVPSAREEV
jgi:hypothetical protein